MEKKKKKRSGVEIDLRESRMSVEQALRELKTMVEDDIDKIREERYFQKPSKVRRERKKKRLANIRKYSKN